jgi:hypothetical protein
MLLSLPNMSLACPRCGLRFRLVMAETQLVLDYSASACDEKCATKSDSPAACPALRPLLDPLLIAPECRKRN